MLRIWRWLWGAYIVICRYSQLLYKSNKLWRILHVCVKYFIYFLSRYIAICCGIVSLRIINLKSAKEYLSQSYMRKCQLTSKHWEHLSSITIASRASIIPRRNVETLNFYHSNAQLRVSRDIVSLFLSLDVSGYKEKSSGSLTRINQAADCNGAIRPLAVTSLIDTSRCTKAARICAPRQFSNLPCENGAHGDDDAYIRHYDGNARARIRGRFWSSWRRASRSWPSDVSFKF